MERRELSGDEAVGLAARDAGAHLALGPSGAGLPTLEAFAAVGLPAQRVADPSAAVDAALGAALGGARALVLAGPGALDGAVRPLSAAAHAGFDGALVIAACDAPGAASFPPPRHARHHAFAAGVPLLEPGDVQEAYDLTLGAFELSSRWQLPVLLRLTPAVRLARARIVRWAHPLTPPPPHRPAGTSAPREPSRWREQKLSALQVFAEGAALNGWTRGDGGMGVIASGAVARATREVAPEASLLELRLVHPLPVEKARDFARSVQRCLVLEDGEPVVARALRAAGVPVEETPEGFRGVALDAAALRAMLRGARSVRVTEGPPSAGEPEPVRAALRRLGCLALEEAGAGPEGLAVSPIAAALGLRLVLPAEEARRVVAVVRAAALARELAALPPGAPPPLVVLAGAGEEERALAQLRAAAIAQAEAVGPVALEAALRGQLEAGGAVGVVVRVG
ncbi:MAG: thiamine pyrophosphate-binding protein [Anaeromyxobacter sp.]